jgi:FkbM family methyltransferase
MKTILKKIIPSPLLKILSIIINYYKADPKVHLKDVFGFDIYQNSNDILNYEKYVGREINENLNDVDGRIFITMEKYISSGSVAIDVGANIGLMSLVMSKLVGKTGNVLSFEPGPVSYGLLRRNIYSNVLNGNVDINDVALSDSAGDFNLFINPNGESDNQLHKSFDTYKFREEVERSKFIVKTCKLDDYLSDNHVQHENVSFIKIDTQGHDLAVLRGARSFLTSVRKIAVLIEFAPYLKAWESQSIEEFYSDIISMGFDVYDDSNLKLGKVDLSYLKANYGMNKIGKYTDLLLLKGQSI